MLEELCNTPVGKENTTSFKPHPYVYSQSNNGETPERFKSLINIDPLAAADWDGKLADPKTDYLANGGIALEEATNADPITKFALRDALELFIGAEMQSRDKIEAAIADTGVFVTAGLPKTK